MWLFQVIIVTAIVAGFVVYALRDATPGAMPSPRRPSKWRRPLGLLATVAVVGGIGWYVVNPYDATPCDEPTDPPTPVWVAPNCTVDRSKLPPELQDEFLPPSNEPHVPPPVDAPS
jgi:hypothetical protein